MSSMRPDSHDWLLQCIASTTLSWIVGSFTMPPLVAAHAGDDAQNVCLRQANTTKGDDSTL
jgi:hypothetical protein